MAKVKTDEIPAPPPFAEPTGNMRWQQQQNGQLFLQQEWSIGTGTFWRNVPVVDQAGNLVADWKRRK